MGTSTMTTYSKCPLQVQEMKAISHALSLALAEIHNPGSARYSNIDLLQTIDDALYTLAHAIDHELKAA